MNVEMDCVTELTNGRGIVFLCIPMSWGTPKNHDYDCYVMCQCYWYLRTE